MRAFADVPFSMQDAARRPAAVTFPADLGHDAGEADEVAALGACCAGCGDRWSRGWAPVCRPGEHTHDLLRAQPLAEGLVYILEDRF